MSPDELYQRLGQLAATVPSFEDRDLPPDEIKWVGTLAALLEVDGSRIESTDVKLAMRNGLTSSLRDVRVSAKTSIFQILFLKLAQVELNVPAVSRGAYIPAGSSHDAMAAIRKILEEAKDNVLVVDPYMDANALTEYAVQAPESVRIRFLTDHHHKKPGFSPAAKSWVQQYASARPIEAREAPGKSLHDRLMIVDDTTAYVLTQSLNAFAKRAPASILKADRELAALKVEAYGQIWSAASNLL
ncbi:hypothetical protein [uncultured Aureimonas sp.]|uniref:hypothetical protein n=1 Tax=uncultured Aureimonas sp. TaxID=1604662 RepID=UPI0025D1524B|nr:hypothetical protein [uncultured Aureimonas sp.]